MFASAITCMSWQEAVACCWSPLSAGPTMQAVAGQTPLQQRLSLLSRRLLRVVTHDGPLTDAMIDTQTRAIREGHELLGGGQWSPYMSPVAAGFWPMASGLALPARRALCPWSLSLTLQARAPAPVSPCAGAAGRLLSHCAGGGGADHMPALALGHCAQGAPGVGARHATQGAAGAGQQWRE